MNKQTAVEWLVQEINKINVSTEARIFINKLEKQAKEMEKQQMFECWETAHQAGRFEGKGIAIENWQTFEQYYNETFGGNNE